MTQGGRVMNGRATEKWSRLFTRTTWTKLSERDDGLIIIRENPSRDYLHPCAPTQIREVLAQLPDPPPLAAFERVVFEHARPGTVVLTTPNREYNATWEGLLVEPAAAGKPAVTKLRHRDHRFEWTRDEFRAWAQAVADRFGYEVRFLPIGPEDPALGPPTQMGLFACR